ncbi:MAG: LegC family aminotransferase [Leptonema illini]|uniref:GDP-perosamine synthase n=1 Tax=Leptonema illini TaxID=183 RepID=A0A833H2Y8_9LEPT|nr:MAG: LegC family aminotransferase [Leptonema illini]
MKSAYRLDMLITALRSALPVGLDRAALHEPCISGNEWSYVKECLDTGWVSSVGSYVDRFEADLASFTGVKRAVAVVNGTAALHICLKLVGVGYDDEVLVPTLTFVATANAVTYCGAIPHFIDSDSGTLGIDPSRLDSYLTEIADLRSSGCYNKFTGRRIAAVVPMHTFGHPVDMDLLSGVCSRFGIPVVEDAAESLGSYYKGRHTGNMGRVAALSFNGNKIVTTGGGGAILTNDEKLGDLAKHLTTTARVSHGWELTHDMVGYNYRLPNINAAVGCAQLEMLPEFLRKKRALALRYQDAFSSVEGVRVIAEPAEAKSNYWLNTLLLDEELADIKDQLVERTNREGLQTRPAWTLMHRLPMYRTAPRMDLNVAESLSARLVNLPSSVILGEDDALV